MNSINPNSFNVVDFDKLVQRFYEGNNTERQEAQTLLTEFRKNPDSWQIVDQILEHATHLQSKFIALGILQEFIKVKWNLLPMDQRLVMRNYVVKLIIELTSDEQTLRSRSVYVNKLNQILVQILKKDWPKYWPTFIQEMLESSKVSPTLCENNMKILKYLSEEVFDFSNDFMTVATKTKMKNQMVTEFKPVFDFCKQLLCQNNTYLPVRTATLETMSKFISWMPVDYLFDQELLETLQQNLQQTNSSLLRNLSLQCFVELVSVENVDPQKYSDSLSYIYFALSNMISTVLETSTVNLNQVYLDASSEEQEFLQMIAIFFATCLPKYMTLIESFPQGKTRLHDTFQFLLKLSHISEREIWKICLETWSTFTNHMLATANSPAPEYQDIVQALCHVMIDNMVKPDDILMIENDDGEITYEFIKQSDTTALSKSTQHVFNLLTRLQPVFVQQLIHDKLKQLRFEKNKWDQLSHVAWAIGSMSRVLTEQQEHAFLNTVVLQDMMQLLEPSNQGQEWAAASCIFYIIEQYPRFLMSNLKFASVLLNKMFGYMQHQQTGVREMACDAFAKISKECKQGLSLRLLNGMSVLEFAVVNLKTLTAQLEPSQLLLFYEASGTLVTGLRTLQEQRKAIQMLMDVPNIAMRHALGKMDSITDLKMLNNIIQLNTIACKSSGSIYQDQLKQITPFLIQAYEIASQGKFQKASQREFYHRICKSVLKLHEVRVLVCSENQNFQFYLFKVMTSDYKNSELREPYLLSLMTTLVGECQEHVWVHLFEDILDIEYNVTLPLLTSNFEDFPDFRLPFYQLLQALNKKCFMHLYKSQLFKANLDSIMWGTKHTWRDVSEIALQTCFDMIQYVSQMEDEDTASQFFETYYMRILTDILEVLVDPDCQNGFSIQSQILARLLEMVQEGEIYVRLFNVDTVENPLMSNTEYIQQYVLNLLTSAFPLLQKDQIEVLVSGMFDYSGELERFQDDIRDFLIDITEVGDAIESQQRADEELNAELDLLRNS